MHIKLTKLNSTSKAALLSLGLFLLPNQVFSSPVFFYFSNNKKIISERNAYRRLLGDSQRILLESSHDLLPRDTIKISALGFYKMRKNKITGDNVEVANFDTSELKQGITPSIIAENLAKKFKQESVLVFYPRKTGKDQRVTLQFKPGDEPLIQTAIKQISQRLPLKYSQAFTVVPGALDKNLSYEQSTASKIIWIGKSIDVKTIKRAFRKYGTITAENGRLNLIYSHAKK